VVIFDKTGTLTKGQPRVVAAKPAAGVLDSRFLEIAASLEAHSSHPLANAFSEFADLKAVKRYEVKDWKALAGGGIEGVVNDNLVWIGSKSVAVDKGCRDQLPVENDGFGSVSYCGEGQHLLGEIVWEDEIRNESKEVIVSLKARGLRVLLLTGDRREVAKAVAERLAIVEWMSDETPLSKLAWVNRFTQSGEKVLFVGDGLNDAGAIAAATVGVSMGKGSALVRSASQLTLLNENLRILPELFSLSAEYNKKVRQNLFFRFFTTV
jgi:ATPase, P-type (transporting), HAD superfamily, subfamily IC